MLKNKIIDAITNFYSSISSVLFPQSKEYDGFTEIDEKKEAKDSVVEKTVIPVDSDEMVDDSKSASIVRPTIIKPLEYVKPPLDLLEADVPKKNYESNLEVIVRKQLESVFEANGLSGKVVNVISGSAVSCYEVSFENGIKVATIRSLHDEICSSMSVKSVRIRTSYPGRSIVSIELPNPIQTHIHLRTLLEDKSYIEDSSFVIPLGIDAVTGKNILRDFGADSAIMIAGYEGSGKATLISSMMCSLLYKYSPQEVGFLMVSSNEPMLEPFDGIPHMILPIATNYAEAVRVLEYAKQEAERRLSLLRYLNQKSIESYNEKYSVLEDGKKLSHIILVIDNANSRLWRQKELSNTLSQLVLKCGNAGIHVLISADNASESELLKSIIQSISCRMSFVQPNIDESKFVIGEAGAEHLLRSGDMLVRLNKQEIIRIATPIVDYSEVMAITGFVRNKNLFCPVANTKNQERAQNSVVYARGDDLFDKAVEIVLENGSASVSLLQRRLGIGYPRCGKLIDEMEKKKIIGPYEGSKPRKVLITRTEWMEYTYRKPNQI